MKATSTWQSSIGVRRCVGAVLALTLVGACSSWPVIVGLRPPANPTLLGAARGSGCGFVLLNLLPLGVNGRLQSATRMLSSQSASGT